MVNCGIEKLVRKYNNVNDAFNFQLECTYHVTQHFLQWIQSTALHIAVANNHFDMVKLLLHKNATKTIKNDQQQIPLDIAKAKNLVEIAELFSSKYKLGC